MPTRRKNYPQTGIEKQLARFSFVLGAIFILVGILMKSVNYADTGSSFETIIGLPFANFVHENKIDGNGTIFLGLICFIIWYFMKSDSN